MTHLCGLCWLVNWGAKEEHFWPMRNLPARPLLPPAKNPTCSLGENSKFPLEADGCAAAATEMFCLLPSLWKNPNCLSGVYLTSWCVSPNPQSTAEQLHMLLIKRYRDHAFWTASLRDALARFPMGLEQFDTKKWTLLWLSSNYSSVFLTVQCMHAPSKLKNKSFDLLAESGWKCCFWLFQVSLALSKRVT